MAWQVEFTCPNLPCSDSIISFFFKKNQSEDAIVGLSAAWHAVVGKNEIDGDLISRIVKLAWGRTGRHLALASPYESKVDP